MSEFWADSSTCCLLIDLTNEGKLRLTKCHAGLSNHRAAGNSSLSLCSQWMGI